MKMNLTESELREMVQEAIKTCAENGEIDESWLGNMFKQGAKSVGNAAQQGIRSVGNAAKNTYNKAANAVGDFNQKVNQATADEYNGKADQLNQEIAGLSAQHKEMVKKYRSKLMSQVNKLCIEYSRKLKAEVAKKQSQMQGYQQKAAGYQDKVDARNAAKNGNNNFSMVAEGKVREMVNDAVNKKLGK